MTTPSSKIRKLPHTKHFFGKLFRNFFAGLLFLAFSLMIGALGYHQYYKIDWVDSIYNASMILTGMGPVNVAPNNSAKLFASAYAIFSGLAFLTGTAIILGPIAHRFLHQFKLDVEVE